MSNRLGYNHHLKSRILLLVPWVTDLARSKSSTAAFFPLAKYSAKKSWYQMQRERAQIDSKSWQDYPRRSTLESLLDYRWPGEWFPQARKAVRNPPRTLHLHVGPTNSGKTHYALQRLIQAQKGGVYCAPLRLLAMEMWERLNGAGRPCALRTGEQICGPLISGEDVTPLLACTVEMVDLEKPIEVAVIDEIQLLADEQRGWAFTQALLALNANHLYLCGEEAVVPLVQRIAHLLGEELTITRYERLAPLHVADYSLKGNLQSLKSGDCVVSFSRANIFNLKEQIEMNTGQRCAVVYGNLPVENRTLQARQFNERIDGYQVLIASDAIGMGLNLNIQRIIFAEIHQVSSSGALIKVPAFRIKQIAGRAGRFGFGVDSERGGIVTCLQEKDLPFIQECLAAPNQEYSLAGLQPSSQHFELLARDFPDLPFHCLLDAITTVGRFNEPFFPCISSEMKTIAYSLQEFPTLSITDRLLLSSAPVKLACNFNVNTFRTFVEYIATEQACPLTFDMKSLANPRAFLSIVESFYRALDLYLWLGNRYEKVFIDREAAKKKREELSALVTKLLSRITKGKKMIKNDVSSAVMDDCEAKKVFQKILDNIKAE